jgi:hypothetical protein
LHIPVSEEAKDGSIVAVKSLFKQGGFATGQGVNLRSNEGICNVIQ